MEFSIGIDELQYIVKMLGYVVKSNVEDHRGRIVIEARDNEVMFLANNESIALEYISKNSIIKKPGAASTIFNKFNSFVLPFPFWNGNFGCKNATIKSTEKSVIIHIENVFEDGTTTKNKLRMDTYNPYSTERPTPFGTAIFTMNSSIMKAAIGKVLYAIDPMEVRGQLQGVRLEFGDDVCLVGTNGVQLSQYKFKNTNDFRSDFTSRYDFMQTLYRALPADDTPIFMNIDDLRIKAKFGNIYMEGRSHHGYEYPEYKPTLESYSNVMSLDKRLMLSILLPTHKVLDTDDHNRITLDVKDKKLKVYSDNFDFEYSGDIDFDGEYIVDVNAEYLKQTIESISDNDLILKFSNEDGVLIFDSKNNENQSSLMTPVKRRTQHERKEWR